MNAGADPTLKNRRDQTAAAEAQASEEAALRLDEVGLELLVGEGLVALDGERSQAVLRALIDLQVESGLSGGGRTSGILT